MQKMILLCRHFCSRTFSFFYVDIFVIVFRRTNNLFGPPSYRLRYFSKDKRKTLWGHNDCYCWGRGGSVAATKRNTGMGWKGKMKLRFVKFLTSRENEIEEKEGGGRRPNLSCLAVTQLARNHSPAPVLALLPHHFHSPSPTPPTNLPLLRSSLSAATDRESNILQLSPPQLSRFSLPSS